MGRAGQRRLTVRDVARAAGVSPSTVSRVLNGSDTPVPVSAKTRATIEQVASELEYRPHPLARGLRGARTELLGAVVRDMANPLFGVAIQALTAEARRVGYNVILANADGDPGQAIGLTEMLETRHCDALIMIGSLPNEAAMLADLASGKHPPTLSLFQGSEPLGVPAINVDNRLGTCLALTHLKELGHHAIAFVGTEEDRGLAERAAEYERFMADNHLPVPPGYRVTVATDQPPGDDFRALLNLPVPPTAVFAATDVLAFRVISVLSAQGVSVPGDVSVVGFDDITLAAIAAPPLTTVRQPLDSMAAQAVRDAIRMANDRSFRPPSLNLFQPELVIRKSCMPPARE